MVKKIAALFLAVLCVLALSACEEEQEVLCMGLDAEITEIDAENQVIHVRDLPEGGDIFGERCEISCADAVENDRLIYVNYDAFNDVRTIGFDVLQVGDYLILSLYQSEKEHAADGSAAAYQIQLGTQRLG